MANDERALPELSRRWNENAAFARAIDGRTIPYWSPHWSRIGRLQRAGLVCVRVITRHLAEIRATEKARTNG